MIKKCVYLENLVLLNKLEQASGGIMEILYSYTDWEGNVLCQVLLTKPLTNSNELKYEKQRIRK